MKTDEKTRTRIEQQFDCYCKRVLSYQARKYYREDSRHLKYEKILSALRPYEANQLYTIDSYFQAYVSIPKLNIEVVVNDEIVNELLQKLSEQKRTIILLYYFLEMSDRAIAELLDMARSTVQYQRSITLKLLANMLKEEVI